MFMIWPPCSHIMLRFAHLIKQCLPTYIKVASRQSSASLFSDVLWSRADSAVNVCSDYCFFVISLFVCSLAFSAS
jgi:hypothetical protein